MNNASISLILKNNPHCYLTYHTDMSNNNEAQPKINTERTSDTHILKSEYNTNAMPQSTMDENTQQPLLSNTTSEWETLRQQAFVIYTNVKEELGNWKQVKITHSLKWSQTKQKSNRNQVGTLSSTSCKKTNVYTLFNKHQRRKRSHGKRHYNKKAPQMP